MGSIRTKKLKDGTARYYAEIRINKQGFPPYRESANFSNKKTAQAWIAKREEKLKNDPKQLFGTASIDKSITLGQAIDRYVDELGSGFGRSKLSALALLKKFDIAKTPITSLSPLDISNHTTLRKNGVPELALDPITPATLNSELIYLFGVLEHADIMWNIDIDLNALRRAKKQLKKTRNIGPSEKRDRLPTSDELIKLTSYFYDKWLNGSHIPMHLVMWFAIYSARRQGEITRLKLKDDLGEYFWVRDVKNPSGSKGNDKKFLVSENCRKIIELFKENLKDDELLVPLNQKSIGARFNEACKVLGIEDLRFHDLRHEACTRLAEMGMTIPQIQAVSLHDSWSSLRRYVSVHKRSKTLSFDDVMRVVLHGQ